jgi:hypothetical protein
MLPSGLAVTSSSVERHTIVRIGGLLWSSRSAVLFRRSWVLKTISPRNEFVLDFRVLKREVVRQFPRASAGGTFESRDFRGAGQTFEDLYEEQQAGCYQELESTC